MAVAIATLILCVVQHTSSLADAIPSYLQICKQNDPDINNCVSRSITKLIEHFRDGAKELGVPRLDPLGVPELILSQGEGNTILKIMLTDVKITGLVAVNITSVRANLEDHKFEITTKAPSFTIDGQYTSEGSVFLLPLIGKGHCRINMTDVTAAWIVYYHSVMRNGSAYMDIEKFGLELMPSDVSYRFNHLYDGDNSLGEAANFFLNENAHEIFNDMKPQLVKELSSIYTDIANQILGNFPENVLLPN